MSTLNDYLNADTNERKKMLAAADRPHRGRPRLFSRPSLRTPTHRGEPRGR